MSMTATGDDAERGRGEAMLARESIAFSSGGQETVARHPPSKLAERPGSGDPARGVL
jgi:hypothetical protein